jgi:hypothetical protein
MWKTLLNDCVRWTVACVPATAVVLFLIYRSRHGERLSGDHAVLVLILAFGSLVMSFTLYWLLGKVSPGRIHEQQQT